MKNLSPSVRSFPATCLGAALLFGNPVTQASPAVNAVNLTGSTVYGRLDQAFPPVNSFDAVNGFVPTGFGNSGIPGQPVLVPVTIGGGVEFGALDFGSFLNNGSARFTADFSSSSVTVSYGPVASGLPLPFSMMFTDSDFIGLSLQPTGNSFPGLFGSNLFSDTLTLSFGGGFDALVASGGFSQPANLAVNNPTYSASFNFVSSTVSPVPEVGQASMLAAALGTVGLIGFIRRRK